MDDHRDWDLLGEAVRQRRGHLGFSTRKQFTEATGFPPKTLYDIEKHVRENFDATTLARLEKALNWAPGSVETVLAGGHPQTPDQVPVVVPTDDMHPLVAELAYVLSADSPVPDEEKEDLAEMVGMLLRRARAYIRSARRDAERDRG